MRGAVALDDVLVEIDAQTFVLQGRTPLQVRAAQLGVNVREQLRDLERLAEVIVRAVR